MSMYHGWLRDVKAARAKLAEVEKA